ncbi:hypothetical protein [Rhizobium mayense]|uniref:Mob protein n=1 Tax=Rhizobium mayense TaxID=1312184 RepID=A0ABT7JSX1_9HYPH|nr:hypothetical protein [Rhizobium mayense]MDL2399442.1 hypothetical protein [Rhizobium mayense]
MGYQFVHLESFSRKADSKGRGTDFIFAEASRKREAAIHVANPLPPVVVFGVDVEQVQEIHDGAASTATIRVKGGHIRKLARDKKTLHTVIASYPATMAEIRADPSKRAEAERWEKRTISWLRSQYGDDLKSVIRHEDEEYFHIHAYIVPTSDPSMAALKYHPGTMAKRAVMGAGPAVGEDAKALSKRADVAYKQSMRAWQDSYHEAVAVPSGLTRLGPQRRRLSRDEWQREKVQAKALQKTVELAREVKRSGDNFVEQTKSKAAAIRAAADQEKQAAAVAKATVEREKEIAAKAIAAARTAENRAKIQQEQAQAAVENARRYGGWSGKLRAIWDGLRKSKIADKIRQEFTSEIGRLTRGIEQKQRQLDAEREQRREAEQSVREARQAAEMLRLERDQAKSILQRLQSSFEPEAVHDHVHAAPSLQLKPKFISKSAQKPRP